MKKSWVICSMEISRLLKKRQTYLLMFVMPLLFTLIFGSLMSGGEQEKMTILLVDKDQTDLSQTLYEQLKEDNALFSLKKSTEVKAKQMIESKKIPGVIIIQKGFQDGMLQSEDSFVGFQKIPELTSSSTITGYVSDKLSKMKIEVTASNQWSQYSGEAWEVMYTGMENSKEQPLAIRHVHIDKNESVPQMNGMSARAAGFSIMFVMMMLLSVTGTIIEARKNGVWYRILATPSSKLEIAFGYLLSFFLIGWIQFGVLLITTHYLFDVQWGNPFSIAILVSALLFAIVGLGLCIAGMVKTVEQQASIGNLIVVSTCMLSGVYWPIEITPKFMQKMAEFLPQTWALRGFTEIIVSGGTLIDIIDNIAILIGFGLLFLVVGMRRIRFE
ncbi:ABC transporter permease [Pseudoneobacillus rhizosphaerae]|uniref:Linearmycin resistance permease protein LnrN n=1 Tax=Pseudoneobacillus rhizosphaerae TaxID=2880968 RepID=A0A9C7G7L9_9BACI|nr:ABC transporter permease [Pseudoneobacillus rhizosphaerae]CAG9607012.1 Linearmycin resistance permease protein LnrN [Pseudoneobacillus rhizosphaerae]